MIRYHEIGNDIIRFFLLKNENEDNDNDDDDDKHNLVNFIVVL